MKFPRCDANFSGAGTLVGNYLYRNAGKSGAGLFRLRWHVGDASSVDEGNPASLQPFQNFTIEAWIKRSDPAHASLQPNVGGTIFSYGGGGYGLGLFDDGTPYLSLIGDSNVHGGQKINDTNFHHLAVTKNGTNVVFYVDGTATLTTSYAVNFQFNSAAAIGPAGGQWCFFKPAFWA